MATSKVIVYTGHKFREYLSSRQITYQTASAMLNMDKNTIGKAVRGGNLNMNVLITICNTFGLVIDDFFEYKIIEENGKPADYTISEENIPLPSVAGENNDIYLADRDRLIEIIKLKNKEIEMLEKRIEWQKSEICLLEKSLYKEDGMKK